MLIRSKLDDRAPLMISDDFNPRSMVDIFVKDLGLALEIGNQYKTLLPLSAAAHQQFLAASGMGYGKLDDSAVVKVYEASTNCPVCRESTAKNSRISSGTK